MRAARATRARVTLRGHPNGVTLGAAATNIMRHAFMRPYRACLLWFTETDIWPSSTNWHLYYRLRQSYGDHRRVENAPGHFFLDYEAPDLVSFLQVAMLAGFDAHLIPDHSGYSRAFLSHDEFVEFAADEGNEELVKEFVSLTSP